MIRAVLDSCVLWPSLQRDFLLSLAVEGAFAPVWSSAILVEVERNEHLKGVKRRIPDAEALSRARRLIAMMERAFPSASAQGWESREGSYGLPDRDDEHVLAAASQARADVIVTTNLRDFPVRLIPASIAVLAPQPFVHTIAATNPAATVRALQQIARRSGRRTNTAITVPELVDVLSSRYAIELREALSP